MQRKQSRYKSEKLYIIVAKFEMKGKEIEKFIPRLKNAKLYWIENSS